MTPRQITIELRFVTLPDAYCHRSERSQMELDVIKEEQRYVVETVVPINMDLVQPQTKPNAVHRLRLTQLGGKCLTVIF